MIAATHFNLGMVAWGSEDRELAADLFETSLDMARKLGYLRLVADALGHRGRVRAEGRDFAGAVPDLEEAMKMQRAMDNREGTLEVIESYVLALAAAGSARKAVFLFEAVTVLRETLALDRAPLVQQGLDRRIPSAYESLSDEERLQVSARARRVGLDEAIALAFDSGRLLLSR
jgi:hypothetical protein